MSEKKNMVSNKTHGRSNDVSFRGFKCYRFCPPQLIQSFRLHMEISIIDAFFQVTVFFFLSRFSFTETFYSQDSRGWEGNIFYFILPIPPAHDYSDIYLQLRM